MYQQTLRSSVRIEGKGVHSGKQARMIVKPSLPNQGIVFQRSDLGFILSIPAKARFVSKTVLNTTLGKNGKEIGTIEHLCATFTGLGIDNATVIVDGPEIPIMDGSSYPFVLAFEKVGLVKQQRPRKYLIIEKPVGVKRGDSFATLTPSPFFIVDCTIEFSHPLIGKQRLELIFNTHSFKSEISVARTFGFFEEAKLLRESGLGLGATLDNCIVLAQDGLLNKEGLRYPDEFVRHKLLDAIGDISLLGFPIIGKLTTFKAGHSLHLELLQEVLQQPDAWSFSESQEKTQTLSPAHSESFSTPYEQAVNI